MEILKEEYQSPTLASRVRLQVFEEPGLGYWVTEEWGATTRVRSTLGLFNTREEALAAARKRGQELVRRRLSPVRPAA